MSINKINQLPTELLLQIFLTLTPAPSHKDRYPHLRLSWVCRYWRRIVNGHGAFWTVIYFSPWTEEQFIRDSVTRSRSAKLSVFLPNNYDVCINYRQNSQLDGARIKKIVTTFKNLLQTEGHRIRFLNLVGDFGCKLPKAVLEKAFPALKTFILHEDDPNSDAFAIIKAAKSLENLDIDLHQSIDTRSLSELKPCFQRLINLKVKFISGEMKRQIFLYILPSCYKLESLTVSGSQLYWNPIRLPSVITFPNLISLNVDCYSLLHKLRAPALKKLNVVQILHRLEYNQHDYPILDKYDVSPVTQLVIMGFEILQPQKSSVVIRGFTGSISGNEHPLTPFKIDYSHLDFRGDNSGPTQFYTGLPTYDTPINGVAPADFKPSPALSKIPSQLHNLERLYITPFNTVGYAQRICNTKSSLELLKTFLNIIFDNLVSSKVRRLAFIKVRRDAKMLRLIFNLINDCVLLSNLDMIEFQTSHRRWQSGLSLHAFGEELVNFLKLRQNAGHRALSRFKVDLGGPLPENCIAEAVALGTQVIQCREGKLFQN